jgi:MFS family permease
MQSNKRQPLAIPAFKRFLLGQTASFLAYQMLAVAVGWQIYDLTHSAFTLGLVGLVQFLPQFLLTLVVGHVADRYDRRRILLIYLSIEGVMAAALAVGSFIHCLNRELILACVFLIGAARAFESPTMQAFLPSLIEPELLPQCLTWSATGRQVGIILGPALGGIVYIASAGFTYASSAACYFLAVLSCLSIFAPLVALRRGPPT